MDLKSGQTFWTAHDAPPADHPPLDRDLASDVAIIGSGITGAFAGHLLTAAGLNVVLVDRRPIGQGSTSASTGLLQYELDTPLLDLMRFTGRDAACEIYRLSEGSLYIIEQLVKSLGISCGLAAKPSLYLATKEEEIETFRREASARQSCGINARFLPRGELQERFAIHRPAAIFSPFTLEVDPYRLSAGLLKAAVGRGMRMFGHTPVTAYHPSSDGVTLETEAGCTIRARHVLFATGYETPEFLHLNVRLKSTFALTSQPQVPGVALIHHCLVWESARPYLYARGAPDGRVIIGGEDIDTPDPVTRDDLLPDKTRALVAKFAELFPESRVVPEHVWAGTFAETPDGLPFIGPSAEFPRGRFALGYGGNGITFSLLAAELIRDELLGRPSPAARHFRLDRRMPE